MEIIIFVFVEVLEVIVIEPKLKRNDQTRIKKRNKKPLEEFTIVNINAVVEIVDIVEVGFLVTVVAVVAVLLLWLTMVNVVV